MTTNEKEIPNSASNSKIPDLIKEYFRNLQKKSALKRKQNDPNTYKKMRAIRTEKESEGKDLIIEVN